MFSWCKLLPPGWLPILQKLGGCETLRDGTLPRGMCLVILLFVFGPSVCMCVCVRVRAKREQREEAGGKEGREFKKLAFMILETWQDQYRLGAHRPEEQRGAIAEHKGGLQAGFHPLSGLSPD